MKKKIAIQLFGHMRTFENCYKSLMSNLVLAQTDNYEVDIFIHTWDEIDHSTINWRNQDGNIIDNIKIDQEMIDKIKSLYNPKDILVEKQIQVEEKLIIEKICNVKRSLKGCINNSYTIYQVNNLRIKYEKEHNFKYDWVICTRPDILFITPFSISDFINQYETFCINKIDNAIYYAYNNALKINDSRCVRGSDLIYFADSDSMTKATSLYENFYENINFDDFYCFEVWWMNYWKKQCLEPMAIDYILNRDWNVIYKSSLPHNDHKSNKNCNNKKKVHQKIFRECMKMMPYFIAHKYIDKI